MSFLFLSLFVIYVSFLNFSIQAFIQKKSKQIKTFHYITITFSSMYQKDCLFILPMISDKQTSYSLPPPLFSPPSCPHHQIITIVGIVVMIIINQLMTYTNNTVTATRKRDQCHGSIPVDTINLHPWPHYNVIAWRYHGNQCQTPWRMRLSSLAMDKYLSPYHQVEFAVISSQIMHRYKGLEHR